MTGKPVDSSATRIALSDAMKALLSERPLSEIRISDITSRCNLSRKSFYYHFCDKYDLLQWIFDTDFLLSVDWHSIEKPIEFWYYLCDYLYENREFYANALSERGQNSFFRYLMQLMSPLLVNHYEMTMVFGEYTKEFSEGLVEGVILFISRWLKEWSYIEPKRLVGLMHDNFVNMSHFFLTEYTDSDA